MHARALVQRTWADQLHRPDVRPPARRLLEVDEVVEDGVAWLRNPNRVFEQLHGHFPSALKMSSMLSLNNCASLNASGRLGSNRPVSIAMMACRDTPTRAPSCSCDQFRSVRSSRSRFFTAHARTAV